MARAPRQPSGDKDGNERRVYNLPSDLVARLQAYQAETGLSTETEAARRLLETALQLRDSLLTILQQLKAGYTHEKDTRILANRVLGHHELVKSVVYTEDGVEFTMKSGDRGWIDRKGIIRQQTDGYDDRWSEVTEPESKGGVYLSRNKGGGPSWDSNKSDLDDEIPF